ncbi:adenylate/guanylate cyclase domain-containing protein [Parafrankia discariae]|uniref:adenylate/guanylate cyclase domain-containing protein n=1 Tax=Parafrankia discariae TaxID=365528 RepID=UPI0005555EBA
METTTVMVVDLVGSTRAIASVPQMRMDELMAEAVLPIRRVVEENGGEIIKFTGDGYLTAFRSATRALHAAAQITDLFVSSPRLPIGEWLAGCRVAIHTCDTTRFEDDLLGEGVVVPARMEKHVPTNVVYVTSTVRDAAKSAEFDFEPVGELALGGIPRPVQVHRLVAERYRGIERDTFLTVTDLVGLNALAARISLTALNERLRDWVSIHREALGSTRGRLRSVAGDNVLSTHGSADEAVSFLLMLDRLARGRRIAGGTEPPAAAPRGAASDERAGEPAGPRPARVPVPAARDEPASEAGPVPRSVTGSKPVDVDDAAGDDSRPPFTFSAVIAHGDLFVPDFGLAGPLVSSTCRTLQALEPGTKIITDGVLQLLTSGRGAFGPELPPVPGGLTDRYHLLVGPESSLVDGGDEARVVK